MCVFVCVRECRLVSTTLPFVILALDRSKWSNQRVGERDVSKMDCASIRWSATSHLGWELTDSCTVRETLLALGAPRPTEVVSSVSDCVRVMAM